TKTVDPAFYPPALIEMENKYSNDFTAFTDDVFSKSVFTQKEKILNLISRYGKKNRKGHLFRSSF
ncbi:MAG: hypothetical protein HC906_14080, partial [Bacteroidales bacterium]|nr:hypothetical protein [Bacteroidales bacterium]